MNFTLHRLRPAEFSMYAPSLVDLYIEAMGYERTIRPWRIKAWRNEVIRPGFTAIVAEKDSFIAGVAYGFLGSPDTWWDRQLRAEFHSQGGPTPEQRQLLTSYFELAEIHVHPSFQGNGIGKALIREVLWNVPARYVLLSTPEVEEEANRAFALYRSLDFFDVTRNLYYPSDERPFAILGRSLPLPAQSDGKA